MISDLIEAFSGADWKTWLGHSLRWLANIAAGLLLAWTVTLVVAAWLHPYVLAVGPLAGALRGGVKLWNREFGAGGDFLRYWKLRDWDGIADSVMDFWGPLLVAIAALFLIGALVL